MKKIVQVLIVISITSLLAGCFFGTRAAVMQRVSAANSEKKPPEYLDIEQQGRIITVSFEISGRKINQNQAAQMRGFHEWATAAITREAPKRECVNVINAFSAGGGVNSQATNSNVSLGSKLQFKCLEKETMMSENDLLADKQVIYAEQINYIDEHPEMIRYK